jgi:hypothetical protein
MAGVRGKGPECRFACYLNDLLTARRRRQLPGGGVFGGHRAEGIVCQSPCGLTTTIVLSLPS